MKVQFDKDEAVKLGLKKAIILDVIRLLIIESGAADGVFAAYLDYKMLHEKLPFISAQTIKRHVESLIDEDFIYLDEKMFLRIRNEFSDEDFEDEAFRFLLKRACE